MTTFLSDRVDKLVQMGMVCHSNGNIRLYPRSENMYGKLSAEDRNLLDSFPATNLKEKVYKFLVNDPNSPTCEMCGKRVELQSMIRGWRKMCSVKCTQNHVYNLGTFTTSGYKHPEKIRQKMSDNHADVSGDNNPFKNSLKDPIKKAAARQRAVDRWAKRDSSWRLEFGKKASKRNAAALKQDVKYHRNHKSGFHVSPKTKLSHFYRSSWELKVCCYLDLAPNVSSYLLEPYYIPYACDKGERYTRIDFEIVLNDKSKILAEVKPLAFVSKCSNKLNGYQKYCDDNGYKFVLLTERNLNKLEEHIC